MTTRSLPDEVVSEILSWLPAKDLLRSRCVCKAWLRLLTIDLHFHNLHLHRLINNYPTTPNLSILLVQLGNNSLYIAATGSDSNESAAMEIHCPFNISLPRQHGIFGICNGLVCLATPSQSQPPNVYIWNPLINDHITIPCPPIPSHFTHRTLSITYGFGFCRITAEFKVIRIISSSYSEEFQSDVSVYTLGTNTWRTLGSIPYDINILNHRTALVNNALHWFAASPGSFIRNVLVSFNLNEEIFQVIPHPDGLNYSYPNHVTIGELGGLLSIFCAYSKEYIEIWVMKEYDNVDSWTKQFRIGRPQVTGEFYFLLPLGFADGGEIIIGKNDRKMILYNPITNSIRRFKKFGIGFYTAYPCIGSIISPRLVKTVNTLPI